MQASETILGPIQQAVTPTEVVTADPSQDVQEQQQAEEQAQRQEQSEGKDKEKEKDKDKADNDDDGSTDAALGLINTAPVQLKNDLEQPVTSGGMDTGTQGPGPQD